MRHLLLFSIFARYFSAAALRARELLYILSSIICAPMPIRLSDFSFFLLLFRFIFFSAASSFLAFISLMFDAISRC